jgi:hypothetical protein
LAHGPVVGWFGRTTPGENRDRNNHFTVKFSRAFPAVFYAADCAPNKSPTRQREKKPCSPEKALYLPVLGNGHPHPNHAGIAPNWRKKECYWNQVWFQTMKSDSESVTLHMTDKILF